MAPLRPLLLTLLNEREKFGDITLIYGARTPELLSYGADRADWTQRDDLHYVEAIDVSVEGWGGRTGFVPAVLEEEAPSADNAVAITCGPPIMIKFTLPVFERLGFAPDHVVASLERRMKCGIGICGRCNIGHKCLRRRTGSRWPSSTAAAGVVATRAERRAARQDETRADRGTRHRKKPAGSHGSG
jgi:NAD(P)H-flavin reductase